MTSTPTFFALTALVSIVLGIVQCFFGYRFFKFVLGLTGFVVAGLLASSIAYDIAKSDVVAILAGLIGGLLGAWLSVALYFVGVFLLGAFLGAVLSLQIFAAAGADAQAVLLVIGAVVMGIVALFVQKFMIMISTAFVGAWITVQGVMFFVAGPVSWSAFPSAGLAFGALIAWLLLGVTGLIVQWQAEGRREVREVRSR